MSSIWVPLAFIAVGAILVARMVQIENKAEDPIVPNRLFKNSKLVIDMILFVFLWGAFVAFNIYIPMWAQGIMGLSALIGGMTQIPGSITNFIGSEAGPVMQRRLGRYNLIAIGTAAFLIAFLGLFIAKESASYWFLLVMGAFEGFGIGLCFNVLQVAVQYDAEPRDVPIATSFAYLVRILSQTFMSAIYGVILNHALLKGVRGSHGQLTMSMMNNLSNSQTAKNLPQHLLPEMRAILFSGIHNIMLTALILILIVVVVLIILFRSGFTKPVKSRDI
jgi:predicted MFS family arabinose efflux permease